MVFIENEPIKNRPPDNFYAFTFLANNSKSKVIRSNRDIFLMAGQNGLIAFIIILLYLVTWLGQLGKSKSKIIRIFVLLDRTVLKLFFVKM